MDRVSQMQVEMILKHAFFLAGHRRSFVLIMIGPHIGQCEPSQTPV
jgi:hypothetical protein